MENVFRGQWKSFFLNYTTKKYSSVTSQLNHSGRSETVFLFIAFLNKYCIYLLFIDLEFDFQLS